MARNSRSLIANAATCLGLVWGLWLHGDDGLRSAPYRMRPQSCCTLSVSPLLRELLLDNPHRCEVVMLPSHTAGERRRAQDRAALDALRKRADLGCPDSFFAIAKAIISETVPGASILAAAL